MNRLGIHLVMGSMATIGAVLILSFGVLAWLEGSSDGDGPGIGIGIALLAGLGGAAAALGLLAGTGVLAVMRWRAGRWASAMHSYACYVGLSVLLIGLIITGLAVK